MTTAIPDQWSEIEFEDFATLQRGKDLTRSQFREGTIPVAGSNGVIGYHDTAIAKAPGITVGRSGSVGKVTVYNEDFWPHNTSLYVRDFHGNDPQFAGYLLESLNLTRFKTGASVPTLDRNSFKTLPVLVPPLPEQKKIAHILSTVQRTIEAQERIIQVTTELKKALMHKLFTEGLRNEPQKQTEIGPIPESWEVVPLGEIGQIERGKFSHRPRNEPRFYGGNYPFVQTGDVSNCDGYVRSYSQTLNEEGLAISKMFPAGTILITIAANIGFTGILQFDSACPDSLIGIFPSILIQTEFLNYYLITQQPKMDQLAPKGTQKNINIQFLKPWLIPLPGLAEQEKISKVLIGADNKIQIASVKRHRLQDLFHTLLHELMTAKMRVN
ncbi:MAG: restriction endonuclease subunit S [Gammaproteobacteria bacterium]|nr:restriction endonuclease subunit S [Gammaproteobacteria bacterium]